MHVPKSGGSSIVNALALALPPESLAPQRFDTSVFCDFEDFQNLHPGLRAQIVTEPHEVQSLGRHRAIAGHFALSTLLQVTDAARIATVLREPQTRLLSLYMYWRTPGISDLWTPYTANEHALRPMAEFLAESRVAPMVDNQLCRMLLQPDTRLPPHDHADSRDIPSIAGDAIARLETLGFVGILELGDTLWRHIGDIFGVPLDPCKINRTGELSTPVAMRLGEAPLGADAIHLLTQRTAADAVVYDFALASKGVKNAERRRLRHQATAYELVKLGDLTGESAGRLAEREALAETLRRELDAHELTRQEQQQTISALREEGEYRDGELRKVRQQVAVMSSSASWRVTAPLRTAKRAAEPIWRRPSDQKRSHYRPSLLSRWPIPHVTSLAIGLILVITTTDALLNNNVILIPLLVVGPICGILTGRRITTAAIGFSALIAAVILCVPDEIWDTKAQLVYVAIVAASALLSISAAAIIERRR
jgi:hypothetical protein